MDKRYSLLDLDSFQGIGHLEVASHMILPTANEDIKVREYLKSRLKTAAVKIIIERPAKNARITIYSARPGVVIGKRRGH